MIVRTLAALACALVVLPARADEGDNCKSPQEVVALVKRAGAKEIAQLSHDQLEFARGFYSASPPPGPYPKGSAGLYARLPYRSSVIMFAESEERVCYMQISPGASDLLANLEGGN